MNVHCRRAMALLVSALLAVVGVILTPGMAAAAVLQVTVVDDVWDPLGDGSGHVPRGAYFQCGGTADNPENFGTFVVVGHHDWQSGASDGSITFDLSGLSCGGQSVAPVYSTDQVNWRPGDPAPGSDLGGSAQLLNDGSAITYEVDGSQRGLTVYTQRPDGTYAPVGLSLGSIVPPVAPPFDPETGDPTTPDPTPEVPPEPEPVPEPEPEPTPEPTPEPPVVDMPEDPVDPPAVPEVPERLAPPVVDDPVVPFSPHTGIEGGSAPPMSLWLGIACSVVAGWSLLWLWIVARRRGGQR